MWERSGDLLLQLIVFEKKKKFLQEPINLICTWCQLTSRSCLCTAQKMKFSIKDFSSKFDQMRSFLQIWSHLLEKFLMGSFTFCALLLFAIIHLVRM